MRLVLLLHTVGLSALSETLKVFSHVTQAKPVILFVLHFTHTACLTWDLVSDY